MLLQGILRRAVVRGLIPSNPVSVVDKPRQPPTRRPEPLPPIIVERIRGPLGHRDATMVSILAYAGLRPDEATRARWRDLTDRTLHVHASKTERARTIKLLPPLVQDLAEWRLASGRPPSSALIFPTTDGDDWKLHDWQNWRRRVYQPAAKAEGVTGDLRVYRLRGSFVSHCCGRGGASRSSPTRPDTASPRSPSTTPACLRSSKTSPESPPPWRSGRPAAN
jgi:integrase